MSAPKGILDLVERFERNLESYKNGKYNETQLRREFLDPFFEALGWDVNNRQGWAEAYKEVIHEDAVKVGGATKAPDYSFRIGGVRKFFVEAKKPSVNIKDDFAPAFQLRRYAWSAKLPLSIVTDFEEFAVYDCRGKPDKNDKPSTGRTLYLTFRQYAERWDEIAAIFAKDAVLKGSFDKYAGSHKAKRGTAEVDDAFLDEIEGWRELLAKNLALRNPQLSCRELNFAVQVTLDRIIFLRICEDRGIEPYGRLQALLNGGNVYGRLKELFYHADDRYNSGLFHFRSEKGDADAPDRLTPGLAIDDKALKDILRNLYYPDCPYEFYVLPADILGQVYEQFLGKVIRLTAGHRAVVEAKPEVRKAGGVFYTPTYIVDYIVKNTVGRQLEGRTPKEAEKLRIVDPACGSGSFLLGAYQYLLDWHLKWYCVNDPDKWAKGKRPALYRGYGGEWRLTTAERKRILLNNIFGVDIDTQAVEVTKLSLLLKVLEGETEQSLNSQMSLFHERALPNLGSNIKCGNSLIGPDFYSGEQFALLGDEEERSRVNAFDWQVEFSEVFKTGGFDAVIGNPPYIRIQALKEWAPREVEFYKEKYVSAAKGNYDIYVVFVEKGLSLLNKSGRLGYILPHKFFNSQYGEPLRKLIAVGRHLADVVHFGDKQIFANATTYTCLLFLDKTRGNDFSFEKVADLEVWRVALGTESPVSAPARIPAERVTASEWNFATGVGAALFDKLSAMPTKLGDVADIFVGLQTSADKVYVLKAVETLSSQRAPLLEVVLDTQGQQWEIERGILKPFLSHVTVVTWRLPQPQHWLLYPYCLDNGKVRLYSPKEIASHFPRAWEYFLANETALRRRESGKADHSNWYGFIYRKNLTSFESPKLIVQVISKTGQYSFDNQNAYFTGGGNGPYYGIHLKTSASPHSIHYLQSLLASSLLDWMLRRVSSPFRGGYWSYGKRFIEQLPIRPVDFSDPADQARHDKMVTMVEQMLALHKQFAKAATGHEQTLVKRQIDAVDRQIDRLVYELYGLTEEEIAIVEGA